MYAALGPQQLVSNKKQCVKEKATAEGKFKMAE